MYVHRKLLTPPVVPTTPDGGLGASRGLGGHPATATSTNIGLVTNPRSGLESNLILFDVSLKLVKKH